MHILPITNNNNSQNFNGTLKIHNCGGQFNRIKPSTVAYVEKHFAERTKGIDGHLDLNMFYRGDQLVFTDVTYQEQADVLIKDYNDDNKTLNKFIDAFCSFKVMQDIKEKMGLIFTGK